MTREQWLEEVALSLLDVVQELAQGLAAGHVPETEWAQVVADSFDQHRAERLELES